MTPLLTYIPKSEWINFFIVMFLIFLAGFIVGWFSCIKDSKSKTTKEVQHE